MKPVTVIVFKKIRISRELFMKKNVSKSIKGGAFPLSFKKCNS